VDYQALRKSAINDINNILVKIKTADCTHCGEAQILYIKEKFNIIEDDLK